MQMKHRGLWSAALAVVVSGLLSLAPAPVQAAPPTQESEPVIYDDIAFPQLPYASRWVEVDGRRIHYYETGDPGGEPILLLHGIPAWSYLWRNVMPHLANSGRVIAMDMQGFGRSDAMETYTLANHAAAIDGFVEALGLKRSPWSCKTWAQAPACSMPPSMRTISKAL